MVAKTVPTNVNNNMEVISFHMKYQIMTRGENSGLKTFVGKEGYRNEVNFISVQSPLLMVVLKLTNG